LIEALFAIGLVLGVGVDLLLLLAGLDYGGDLVGELLGTDVCGARVEARQRGAQLVAQGLEFRSQLGRVSDGGVGARRIGRLHLERRHAQRQLVQQGRSRVHLGAAGGLVRERREPLLGHDRSRARCS
jgi:hypothetical protein